VLWALAVFGRTSTRMPPPDGTREVWASALLASFKRASGSSALCLIIGVYSG
jgi:hypothetical protein